MRRQDLRDTMIPIKTYLLESDRIKTFELEHYCPEQVKNLVEGGFHVCPFDKVLKCVFCNMEVTAGGHDDLVKNKAVDARKVHQQINKDCPFVNNLYVGNKTLAEENLRNDIGYKDFGNLDYEIQRQAKYPEYKTLNNRMFSYLGKRAQFCPLTVPDLSEAGFFKNFKDGAPCVTCYLCGVDCTTIPDDCTQTASQLHKEMSPDCPLLKCTPRTIFDATPVWTDADDVQEDIDCKQDDDERKNFADSACRYESFSSFLGCPDHVKESLVKAGFFYTGSDDRAQCYKCSFVLKDLKNSQQEILPHPHIKESPKSML